MVVVASILLMVLMMKMTTNVEHDFKDDLTRVAV